MKTFTKILAAGVSAAALAAVAAPSQAAVYIGLQQAGVNGGAITEVGSGAIFASYGGSYGTFELNFSSGTQGVLPVISGSTAHNQNNTGAGGTIDVYVTRDDVAGPVPNGFFSSFTSNILPTGWTVVMTTYVDTNNGKWGGTQLATETFTNIGTDKVWTPFAGGQVGNYSTTQRYTIIAPTTGESLSTMSITAVPEPATWGLMIMGFGGAGAMIRSRRRAVAAAA